MNNLDVSRKDCVVLQQQLLAHHETQLNLCNTLEEIADSLPNIPDVQHVLVICRDLLPIVKSAHQFEEKTFFPILKHIKSSENGIERNLERLQFEHWEDECFAEEITEDLRTFVDKPVDELSDKLSYMLRGFFEGVRRHIAFETEYLLPALNTLGEKNN